MNLRFNASNQPINTKHSRVSSGSVRLPLIKGYGSLVLASSLTLLLMAGLVLSLILTIIFIQGNFNPAQGLAIAVSSTIIINLISFLIAPSILDITQNFLYQTRWLDLNELARRSPEASLIIRQVCINKNLKEPRLGIINDQNPTAFTYGTIPNKARIIVSEGLFTYLNDNEIAAVYAHELGHIIHWDFAIMTLASTLIQICYSLYIFCYRKIWQNNNRKELFQVLALAAFVFYKIGTYWLLYLSRVREYFADHFSAEVTGNPNALSRALVKIGYGLVEEKQKNPKSNILMESTRALGIYDYKSAVTIGATSQISESSDPLDQVLLWDLFNPWRGWLELRSTHPLTGKRIRALSNYAEQLDLTTEFDMAKIVRAGKILSKDKLYGGLLIDIILYFAEAIGLLLGVSIGLIFSVNNFHLSLILGYSLIGLGMGIFCKTFAQFPLFFSAPKMDILSLMSNPYASSVWGKPVKLKGKLIGRRESGFIFSSDIEFQDLTGLLPLRYSSRFGLIGNFFFGISKVEKLMGMEVNAVGWFRRKETAWLDLSYLSTENGTIIKSYHRFLSIIFGILAIIVGIFLNLY